MSLAQDAHINLHVTDWVTTQQEDPTPKTAIKWIFDQKVQDLKYLLGDDANTEELKTILSEWKKLTLYQEALYHCHTPIGELEEVLWFVVPMAHQVAAMNGFHQDAGHQGQQQIPCLLHAKFWWPGMAAQMLKVISNCEQCIQHECTNVKGPVWSIIVTVPLELLHIDFTSIETMMELDHPQMWWMFWSFVTTFMKYIMSYVTPNQTAKTVAKFLWQGYSSIFGVMAKLLSDWGANLESNIITELCELMGIQKVKTLLYHA